MDYEMIQTNTTFDEIQGYINLNLAIVLQACIDADIEWLESSQFRRTVLSLPDKILQREMGIGLVDMSAKQIAFQLIKRVRRGDFKGRRAVI
jgi:hypothetical protein